jgi:lipopolysaccharide/colanic/teichoic acid biosynthesis glycosyltransferase
MYVTFGKRLFDIVFSIVGLLILLPFLLLFVVLSWLFPNSFAFFSQTRVGQFGHYFTLYKIRSIDPNTQKVTPIGSFLRNSKLDELPQLWNILKGDMSFVGPRPDVPGYYDVLEGEERKLLELKPGLTCEASIKYANEEALLAEQEDPLHYNDTVVFRDKVRMNLEYYDNRSFFGDLGIIFKTIIG